jgi:hypothetical protein
MKSRANPTRDNPPSVATSSQDQIPTLNPILPNYTQIPGCEFPPNSKEVIWPGGTFKTKLPWISDPEESDKNVLQNVMGLIIKKLYRFHQFKYSLFSFNWIRNSSFFNSSICFYIISLFLLKRCNRITLRTFASFASELLQTQMAISICNQDQPGLGISLPSNKATEGVVITISKVVWW